MDIKIKNIDALVVGKIDELAKNNGLSRNEYLKRCLTHYAILPDVQNLDSKYNELVGLLVDRLDQANDIIESNTALFEKILDRL